MSCDQQTYSGTRKTRNFIVGPIRKFLLCEQRASFSVCGWLGAPPRIEIRQAFGQGVTDSRHHPFILLVLCFFSNLPFILWVPIVFWIYRARIVRRPGGGPEINMLGPIGGRWPTNCNWNSVLFLIPFFFDVGSILAPKMVPKSTRIL